MFVIRKFVNTDGVVFIMRMLRECVEHAQRNHNNHIRTLFVTESLGVCPAVVHSQVH